MPSFDVVSEVDLHNLTNAVDQANRVITTRFDFKGVDAQFEREERSVTMVAEQEFQMKQMLDMLQSTVHKSGISIECMDIAKPVQSGKQCKQLVTFKHGIESDIAKKLVKAIKDKKFKVQTQIQGEQLRVTGKKRDDLQAVIAFLRDGDYGQPLQFNNFRD
jgi:uncharacterized protein YajQ (UPF0234 family)